MGEAPTITTITPRLLRRWPLPRPDPAGDKEDRGRVLLVGGAPEMPGAAILAATAVLRAGAGKVQLASPRSVASLIAGALPEGRVFAQPETGSGAIAAEAAAAIAERAGQARALLIGPGLVDDEAIAALLERLMPRLRRTSLVLDALALPALAARPGLLQPLDGAAVITPHVGEMATILGRSAEEVEAEPLATATDAARRLGAVVALKGSTSYIAGPDGACYRNRTGNVGLATSGSGDTLSGIIAGLLARGAEPLQATAWAVHLHGRAGDRLSRRVGPLGYLARELLAEIPPLMAGLGVRRQRSGVRGRRPFPDS